MLRTEARPERIDVTHLVRFLSWKAWKSWKSVSWLSDWQFIAHWFTPLWHNTYKWYFRTAPDPVRWITGRRGAARSCWASASHFISRTLYVWKAETGWGVAVWLGSPVELHSSSLWRPPPHSSSGSGGGVEQVLRPAAGSLVLHHTTHYCVPWSGQTCRKPSQHYMACYLNDPRSNGI